MKKSFRFLVVGLLLISFVDACSQVAVPTSGELLQGNISISGAFALYPLMTRWAEEFQNIHPGLHFSIESGGAGKGMTDILTQKVDIGMVSREITSGEEAQGAYPVAVAKDAVFPMVNAKNPVLDDLLVGGMTRETLAKIFISGEIDTWGKVIGKPEITDEIHVYTRTETCGAAEVWGMYLGGGQTDLLGDGRFGDTGIIRALVNDPLGIGYSNQIYAYGLGNVPPEGTLILPIDLNENKQVDPDEILDTRQKAAEAVASGLYPAPPARILYLVTNEKPDGVVQAFLSWILTDGQAFVEHSGYVPLSDEQLGDSIQRIQ